MQLEHLLHGTLPGLCLLVLAEWIPDWQVLRGFIMAGLLIAVSTLLFRIYADVVEATTPYSPITGSRAEGDC